MLDVLAAARRPVIVAGGGIINADAADLLVEFAELVGVPVIPTLIGWGAIPDDHRLMAGMAGLQTAQRYGNANLLAADLVLGIGNRWANRHTGGLETTRGAPLCTSTSNPPRSDGSSPPTSRSSPTPRLRSSGSSRSPASGPSSCPTAPRGSTSAWSASGLCCAAPTSTTCRSSRSGFMKR